MKIVILDGYTLNPGDQSWKPLEQLGEVTIHDRTPLDQVVERAAGAQIVLTNKTVLKANTIRKLTELKFICVLATGFNVVDVAAARARGVAVSNIPEYSTNTVSQFTFALLLELCHRVQRHSDSVYRGDWQKSIDFTYWLSPQMELAGKTMGLVGFGKIGRAVGRLAHAFGMNVLAHARRRADAPEYSSFAWADLEELFTQSDVVSLHCPLNDQTAGMVNAEMISLMKPSALLINTARGGLVNERALAAALNENRIAGAAVDVVSTEPIKGDNPLLKASNCVITPHIAWTTPEARRRVIQIAAANVRAFIEGRPINVVN